MLIPEPIEREFSYRASWKNIVVPFSLGAVLGALAAHEASTNNKRLIINGLIELSVSQATVFFWAISVFMFALVLLALMSLLQKLRGPTRIAVTRNGIVVPGPPWAPTERYFLFSDITSMKLVNIYKQNILQVVTRIGKFAVTQQNMSSVEEFKSIVMLLKERANLKHGV
jgi:hypothetical protein